MSKAQLLLLGIFSCVFQCFSQFDGAQQSIFDKQKGYFDIHGISDEIEGVYSISYEGEASHPIDGFLLRESYDTGGGLLSVKRGSDQGDFDIEIFQNNGVSGSMQGSLFATAAQGIFSSSLKYPTGIEINPFFYIGNNTIRYDYVKPREQLEIEAQTAEYSPSDSEWYADVTFSFNVTASKMYPPLKSVGDIFESEATMWSSNGSGVIVSEAGHIVTNYHVINHASKIEIEVLQDGESVEYDASVVQIDRVNDLAIIKVVDVNFTSFDSPPFSLKFSPSEVGTKVYAYGYPMALTAMGKEVKVTDGIISSKTGFNGDVTTYQISAPIQGGNSGGPLFDENANLVGINSSGLDKEIADNVGYSIKSSFVRNIFDVLPQSVSLPSDKSLQSKTLVEQIAAISPFVVLVKVK